MLIGGADILASRRKARVGSQAAVQREPPLWLTGATRLARQTVKTSVQSH
jgi:hypothetical protein